jgi:hypothetical protein
MSLYWLEQMLAGTPYALLIYIGLGIPWALVLLPRVDWRRRTLVIMTAFALGPALLTAWMLIPGWLGGYSNAAYLQFWNVTAGVLVLIAIGSGLAWRKWKRSAALPATEHSPLAFDERVLLFTLGIALVLRWFVTAYWPFTAYDALWVYGYEGRLYTLRGYIPNDIGYYPQFLPLQFTYIQLAVGGISDHAARSVIPLLHLGSILAAFNLGRMLFHRRTGIFLAVIWGFYPHVAEWAHIGDLEIPLTFLLTATSTFLLAAWFASDTGLRRRYSILAGLMFGIAMWTKPTAGAFIWGVALLVLVALIVHRFNWRRWLPYLEIAVLMGIACIPLGSIWYVRNFLLGLPVLVFPHASWLSRATRSGDLLGWLVLALFLALVAIAMRHRFSGRGWLIVAGVLLLLAGTMPSSPLFNPERRDPPASYLSLLELGLIAGGVLLIASQLVKEITERNRRVVTIIGYSYVLATPYFLTWFWSYSYHARLSFAIVPLLILPSAALIAYLLPEGIFHHWQRRKQVAWSGMLILIVLPSIVLPLFSTDARYHDWLWVDRYPDDFDRYRVHNPDVTLTAEHLLGWREEHGTEPTILAPGEQRLRFFLPDATIISQTVPTTYADLEGVTHYLYGSLARWWYEDAGITPLENRIVSSLARPEIMTQNLRFADGTFRYELYEVHLEQQITDPAESNVYLYPDLDVVFGDFARLQGSNVGNTQIAGNRIFFDYLWEVLAQPQADYTLRISLVNLDDNQIYYEWEAPVSPGEHAYYSTLLWQPGEFIIDSRSIIAPTDIGIPAGQNYRLVLNIVEISSGEAVAVQVNGVTQEGGFTLPNIFQWGN